MLACRLPESMGVAQPETLHDMTRNATNTPLRRIKHWALRRKAGGAEMTQHQAEPSIDARQQQQESGLHAAAGCDDMDDKDAEQGRLLR